MIFDALSKGLKTSFLDYKVDSEEIYQAQLVQNSYPVKKVIDIFESELETCESFWFTTAFFSMSGLCTLYSLLEDLERRNVPGCILVSQYLNFTQPDALNKLKQYSNIKVRIETNSNLHAKIYMFKHQDHVSVLLGSSNLTANALSKNEEMNILVRALPQSKFVQDITVKKQKLFEDAQEITKEYLEYYDGVYQSYKKNNSPQKSFLNKTNRLQPNMMQQEALNNLEKLRENGAEKALLISATGTGKTYLSAFDAFNMQAQTMLFIVHRENILIDAKQTFQNVFGLDFKATIFSGSNRNIEGYNYVFATIQSLSKDNNFEKFAADKFDYIIIDESHRSGAESYLKIIKYFKPKFLLGMTATPERTDGVDIFKAFDYNIAYEIRLKKAMECDLVCPFHYFGISDLEVDGILIDKKTDFRYLVSNERVKRIQQASEKFGTDSGELRALIFCSDVKECMELAAKMNANGVTSISLTGANSIVQRAEAIRSISSNDDERIKMIFTVDVFNEGIDIPKINQIIFLRETESSIIYLQQLGRGLRKTENKEYVTIIDFIGNYEKNFLIPMALFGDNSYNKDQLRKLVKNGGSLLPGASTIHFDEIAKEKIFASINNSNFQQKKELNQDYKKLKDRLGRMPMMMDFFAAGARDPFNYVVYSKSYYSFIREIEDDLPRLDIVEESLLQFFSLEINNTKRILESFLLLEIITSDEKEVSIQDFKSSLYQCYKIKLSQSDIASILNNLNMIFSPLKYFKVNGVEECVILKKDAFSATEFLKSKLGNKVFYRFIFDDVKYAIYKFNENFSIDRYNAGFIYYSKYARKDVFRVLNWKSNQNPQNVGGYLASKDLTNCPIFVTYHKGDDISDSTKYEDKFVDAQHFQWMSKSKRKLTSPDVQIILNAKKNGTLLPLFVKKDDDEGLDFYFIGLLSYLEGSAVETSMNTESGPVSVVKIDFQIDKPVDVSLYKYLTTH